MLLWFSSWNVISRIEGLQNCDIRPRTGIAMVEGDNAWQATMSEKGIG